MFFNKASAANVKVDQIVYDLQLKDNKARFEFILEHSDWLNKLNQSQIGIAHYVLGYSYESIDKNILAKYHFNLADEMIIESQYVPYKIATLLSLAILNTEEGYIEVAKSQLLRLDVIINLLNQNKKETLNFKAWCRSAESILSKKNNEFAYAVSKQREASILHQKIGNKAAAFVHNVNFTSLFIEMNNIDSAKKYWNLSKQDLNNSRWDSLYLGEMFYLKGRILQMENRYVDAIKSYDSASVIYKKFAPNNTDGTFYMARLLYEKGNLNESKYFFESSINVNNELSRQKEIFSYLKLIYNNERDFQAESIIEKKIDSISNLINSKQIENNQYLFKKDFEMLLAKSSLLEKQLIIEKNQIRTLLSAVLSSIVFLAFFLVARRRRMRLITERNKLDQSANFYRMKPHFIYNTLSSLQYRILKENNTLKAATLISEFSDMARSIFSISSEQTINLEDEIKFLRSYVNMENFRFNNKFEFTLNVRSNLVLNEIEIPPMMLQPLLENSINHGFVDSNKSYNLKVNIIKESNWLVFEVIDDGIGFDINVGLKENHALSIFKKRLKLRKLKEEKTIVLESSKHGTKFTFKLNLKQ